MAGSGSQTAPRSGGRGLRIALLVSLAANLLIVGLVAGAIWHGPPDRARRPELRDLGFGPFVAALPRSDRRALAARLRDVNEPLRARRDEIRRQFDALVEALRAEPYDHGAVAAIISSQQDEVFASQRLGRSVLLDHIAAMSADARADFAAALVRNVRHWKHGGPPRRD